MNVEHSLHLTQSAHIKQEMTRLRIKLQSVTSQNRPHTLSGAREKLAGRATQ